MMDGVIREEDWGVGGRCGARGERGTGRQVKRC